MWVLWTFSPLLSFFLSTIWMYPWEYEVFYPLSCVFPSVIANSTRWEKVWFLYFIVVFAFEFMDSKRVRVSYSWSKIVKKMSLTWDLDNQYLFSLSQTHTHSCSHVPEHSLTCSPNEIQYFMSRTSKEKR